MTTTPTRRPQRRRRRLAVALALGTLTPSTACGVIGGGGGVTLMGDSLTVLVGEDVGAGLNEDVDVSATWGLRIDEELDPAAEIASDDPEQVVINLGTNNILQHHDTIASAEDLSAMLDIFEGVDCVHVVTINEQINWKGEDLGPPAAALNEQIRTLAGRRLNVSIIDWNQIVVDNAANDILDSDTVHPNPAGVELLTKAYVDAIKAC